MAPACYSTNRNSQKLSTTAPTKGNAARPNPNLLENILDISATVAQILEFCGVDKSKSNKAVGCITQAFMEFDEQHVPGSSHPCCKTRHIRKEDLHHRLQRDCCMTASEAKLTTSVVTCAFRAFYHKQSLRNYNIGYYSEGDWQIAAQRTIAAYAKTGATKSQLELAERRVQEAYKNYLNRVSVRGKSSGCGNDFAWQSNNNARLSQQNHCCREHNQSLPRGSSSNPRGKSSSAGQYGMPWPLCISNQNDHMNHTGSNVCGRCNNNDWNCDDPPQQMGTDYQQVVCTCCGCVKASPASYRDSKGRSIILLEDNELYYNSQPMKGEVRNISEKILEGVPDSEGDSAPNQLCGVMMDMARSLIYRALREQMPTAYSDGTFSVRSGKLKESMARSTQEGLSTFRQSFRQANDCECGDNVRKKGEDKRKSSVKGSRQSTKFDDYEEMPENGFELRLQGICQPSMDGRSNFDISGLTIRNGAQVSEFKCISRKKSDPGSTRVSYGIQKGLKTPVSRNSSARSGTSKCESSVDTEPSVQNIDSPPNSLFNKEPSYKSEPERDTGSPMGSQASVKIILPTRDAANGSRQSQTSYGNEGANEDLDNRPSIIPDNNNVLTPRQLSNVTKDNEPVGLVEAGDNQPTGDGREEINKAEVVEPQEVQADAAQPETINVDAE